MTRSRWPRRLAITATVAALLVGVAVVGLPRLVDSDTVRLALERRISTLAGGDVHYDSLSLSLFPSPSAELRNVTLRVPDSIDLRVRALEIGIAPIGLLAGEVRVTAIRAAEPVVTVRLAPRQEADPIAAYGTGIRSIADGLVRGLPGTTVAVTSARVELVAAGQRRLSIADLALTADVSAAAIDATVSCGSDLWRRAQARLRLTPESLAASLHVEIQGLDAVRLQDALRAHAALAVRGGTVDASFDATTDGRDAVRGTLSASTPQLVITRGQRSLDLGPVRVALQASRDAEALTVTLDKLVLGELVPAATGVLRARLDGGAPAVELQVPELDIAGVNAAASAIAGDIDAVRATAAVLIEGKLAGLSVAMTATDFSTLARGGRLRAESRLEAATLRIPAAGVTASNVAGRVVVAEGALSATGLAGTIGNGSFRAGTLALQLAPAVSLHQLKADVDADLAEALPVVRRLFGSDPPPVLAGIESLTGRAAGTVVYDVRNGRSRYEFDTAKIAGKASHRRLPFPLEVDTGALRYAGDRLELRRLAGRLGRSQVNELTAEIGLGARAELLSASADLIVVLEEFYPLLASLEALRPALRGLDSVTGTATVQVKRLAGPVTDPAALDFDVALAPRQLHLVTSALPGPLTIDGGSVAVLPRALRFERVGVALLDGRITATGTVDDYASSSRRFDLALTDAAMGVNGIEWARKQWRFPLRTMLRAPVGISAGQVDVSGSGQGPWSVRGALDLAAGARTEFDLAWQDDGFDLRRFTLTDAWSNATLALKRTGRTADLSFSGTVDNRTLERILLHPPSVRGALRGKFTGSIDLDRPRRSTAAGTLDAEGVDLLERWGVPVIIERLHLEASGSAARVTDTAVAVAGQRLVIAGTVESREKTFAIDARLSAEQLDLGRLLAAFGPAGGEGGRGFPAVSWELPVEGRVALAVPAVTLGQRVLRSVAATASLVRNRVSAEVSKAQLCGIALPFTAVLTPNHAVVDGKALARDEPLEPTLSCLAGESIGLSGSFDLDGAFAASGPPAALLDSAQGSFRITARAGRVQRLPVVNHILALDAVAERTTAEASAVNDAAPADSRIAVTGTFAGSRVDIDSATLDKPFLGVAMSGEIQLANQTVDMHGLAAPFTTVTEALRHVPLLGGVLGARVVGIPIRVTGALKDPTVTLLGAAAVSRGLVDLMAAMLKAPVHLLDPLLGKRRDAP